MMTDIKCFCVDCKRHFRFLVRNVWQETWIEIPTIVSQKAEVALCPKCDRIRRSRFEPLPVVQIADDAYSDDDWPDPMPPEFHE